MIVVFDTETTGLLLHPSAPLEKQPRIIELGAALVAPDGTVVDTYNQLVHPGEQITAEITKITGITNEQVADAPPFAQVLPALRAFFARADGVVAHNLPFDKGMLMNELRRCGVTDFPWPQHELCTVGANRATWGRNPKMTELYAAVLGKPLAQTHRALDDVLALVEIVVAQELAGFV